MMAPLPPPDPRSPPPAAPADGVWLAVRLGTGRPVTRPMTGDEFLIGGAAGCDLRLPGPNLPPVVCQLTRTPDGLRVRRRATAIPVFLNDAPLADPDPVPVADGDRVTVGPAELVAHIPPAEVLVPRLVPFDDPGSESPARPASPDSLGHDGDAQARRDSAAPGADRVLRFQRDLGDLRQALVRPNDEPPAPSEEVELTHGRAELENEYRARFDALDADFARRRQELESEHDRRRTADEAVFADRLRQIEEEIARRRLQFELEVREYEPRFAELQLRRRQVEEAVAELARERQALETVRAGAARERDALGAGTTEPAPDADREAELVRREEQLRADRERYAADLARLDRWHGELDARQESLDRRAAEIDQRHDRLTADTAELEDQVRLADAEQTRLAADAERLDRVRSELEVREGALAERTARAESQQATLAVLRARLDRQQEELHREAAQLAADHARMDAARRELDARLRDAEQLRADLGTVRADHESQRQALVEQHSLLAATLEDIRRQKEAVAAEDGRLRQKEQELDARSADIAEQAAVLKARAVQVAELQDRLEADRLAVRAREGGLADAEAARQALQEQLRRRADDLSARARQFDDLARQHADDRAALDRLRAEAADERARAEEYLAGVRRDLDARAGEIDQQAAGLAEREAALTRQVARVKEVGQAVAAERKALAEARAAAAAERGDADAFRARVVEQMAELRRQAPDLENGARDALDRLAAARDVLRGHLAELHDYARQAREELDAARGQVRTETDHLLAREQELERARSDHRLAVSGFRQQLLDWQAKVAELKQAMAQTETRLEQRRAEVDAAVRQVDATTQELARKEAELRHEQEVVAEKRSEMERHLADMRDWYRKKLRELAAGRPVDESDMPVLSGRAGEPGATTRPGSATAPPGEDEVDPGDRHLGELLQSRGLVDADTLQALWAEARRQRRTLRQVLLASGSVTLYQLALIEAGNLDALVLGRLRVIDRVRATPRETVYRVFDPARRAVGLLRHLAETEMHDAVRPDEFRQRFAAAAAAPHPYLANTIEVLEINGRPAALQELVVGLTSPDWPAGAAVPGVWVKLLAAAARGLSHAHRAGLVHGRLAADAVVLTADGAVKILGFGEPPWLAGPGPAFDPPPAADLRALGQVAFGWSQLAGKKRGARAKPFPPPLAAVIRRLEAGSEPPMADVVSFDRPYADAAELVRDLDRLASDFPAPADTWDKLVAAIAEALQGSADLRQSA